jgi:ABC-2 type transport system permease protein
MAVFGLAAGGASTLADQLANTPDRSVQVLLQNFSGASGASALDAGVWSVLLIFAYTIALYPVMMVQRLRVEETSGRAEAVQGTTMTRLRWASGHLAVASVGTAVLLAVAGLVFGAAYALFVTGSPADVLRLLGGALGMIPAAWVVGGLCVLAYGLLPRLSIAIGWAVWVFVALSGQVMGPLYNNWGGSPLEPFHYVSNTVAGGSFQPAAELALLVVAGLLAAGGLLTLRRRDFG